MWNQFIRKIFIKYPSKEYQAGNSDFRIWDGNQQIVCYIEVKIPAVKHLDQIEQLKRYRHTFPNLILTNFFEFGLYRYGNLIDDVLIARPFVAHKPKTTPPIEKEAEFLISLRNFFPCHFQNSTKLNPLP